MAIFHICFIQHSGMFQLCSYNSHKFQLFTTFRPPFQLIHMQMSLKQTEMYIKNE